MKEEGGLRYKNSAQKKPLISIITIVYNGEKTIERTIRSVLNQTYNDIEYIIIDGNSNDATLDVLKKYSNKIDYWVSEKDNGISDAFNKGIKLATGELIGFINADDWYETDACAIIASCYNEKIDVYVGDCMYLFPNGERKLFKAKIDKLKKYMSVSHPSCFIRKDCYSGHGDYSLDYPLAMDYDLLLRLYTKGLNFYHVNSNLSTFVLGGVSNKNVIKSFIECREIKNNNFISNKLNNLLFFYFLLIKQVLVKIKNHLIQ
jgi:glycosyltransferase involved in cell wall biosynthesis